LQDGVSGEKVYDIEQILMKLSITILIAMYKIFIWYPLMRAIKLGLCNPNFHFFESYFFWVKCTPYMQVKDLAGTCYPLM
jgi:hypothetical protein